MKLANLVLGILAVSCIFGETAFADKVEGMQIILKTAKGELRAELNSSATAKAFADLLPLELDLTDYAKTEKVADLPQRLSMDGSPAGVKPSIGDITYYSPWGNLAIFYKDFGYASGLVKLGHIDGDLNLLTQIEALKVRIERIQDSD